MSVEKSSSDLSAPQRETWKSGIFCTRFGKAHIREILSFLPYQSKSPAKAGFLRMDFLFGVNFADPRSDTGQNFDVRFHRLHADILVFAMSAVAAGTQIGARQSHKGQARTVGTAAYRT